jgi:HK97 family phage prohead protease
MASTLIRAFGLGVELRADGRTLIGLAVPYGKPTEIYDAEGHYFEQFTHGAFARSISQRKGKVPLLGLHDRKQFPLGPIEKLSEGSDGLIVEAHLSKTRAGDEALELVRDGALTGLSVSFTPLQSRWDHQTDPATVSRTEARLNEVSLVPFPAYADAQVLAMRESTVVPSIAALRGRLAAALLPKDNR